VFGSTQQTSFVQIQTEDSCWEGKAKNILLEQCDSKYQDKNLNSLRVVFNTNAEHIKVHKTNTCFIVQSGKTLRAMKFCSKHVSGVLH
jgi:hypothetical protein